jgi:hypothetical protein
MTVLHVRSRLYKVRNILRASDCFRGERQMSLAQQLVRVSERRITSLLAELDTMTAEQHLREFTSAARNPQG